MTPTVLTSLLHGNNLSIPTHESTIINFCKVKSSEVSLYREILKQYLV